MTLKFTNDILEILLLLLAFILLALNDADIRALKVAVATLEACQ